MGRMNAEASSGWDRKRTRYTNGAREGSDKGDKTMRQAGVREPSMAVRIGEPVTSSRTMEGSVVGPVTGWGAGG